MRAHGPAALATAIGGLVQVIVTEIRPLTFSLFLNDTEVSQIDVDSLSIDVEVPTDGVSSPTVRATLVTALEYASRSASSLRDSSSLGARSLPPTSRSSSKLIGCFLEARDRHCA